MPKMHWTKPEAKAVMAEAKRLLQTVDSNLPQAQLIARAQLALPIERRVARRSSSFLSSFFKKMRELDASGHLPAAGQPLPPAPAAENPGHDSAPNGHRPAHEDPPIIVVERKVIVHEAPDYGRIPTVTLARLLLERLAHLEEVEARMLDFTRTLDLKRQSEAAYDRRLDPRPPDKQPAEDPVRICIVGVLPAQRHEIEAKTAAITRPLKLKFYDANHEGQPFPALVDYIIVTRFVSHKWTDKAKAALPGDCVFFLDGGLQEIVNKIYGLCSRQTSPSHHGNGHPRVPASLTPQP